MLHQICIIASVCVFIIAFSLSPAAQPAQPSVSSHHIAALVRQTARWSTAAKQDESAMIAVLHANYGAGYLWALKEIASSDEIEAATGISFNKFQKQILEIQDAATIKMATLCPAYAPPPSYLTSISGEGRGTSS
jgi:hypothetical protein